MPTFNCPCDDVERVVSPTQTHTLIELGGGHVECVMIWLEKCLQRLMCYRFGSFFLSSPLALCGMCVYMCVCAHPSSYLPQLLLYIIAAMIVVVVTII